MAENSDSDVIKRKAQAGRDAQAARVVSPARALRLALSRAAEELYELAVAVSGVQYEQIAQEPMLRAFDDEMLFLVLDGPQGALGAAAFDLSLVAGLVEKQTIGRVTRTDAPGRAATATDAALVAPFLDAVISMMSEQFQAAGDKLGDGYRFGARLESRRHLGLMVEAPDFHLMRAQVELDGGAKRGEFVLSLPIAAPAPRTWQGKPDAKPQDGTAPLMSGAKVTMREGALMEAPAQLRAVVHREPMTLGSLAALRTGDRLVIGSSALRQIELDAGVGAPRLGPCKLGKIEGARAVKLRFGAMQSNAEEFEPLSSEPVLFDNEDLAEGAQPEAAPQEMITVDDLPDLSDLPGFEDAPSVQQAEPDTGAPGAEAPLLDAG